MFYLSIPSWPDPQGPAPVPAFAKVNGLSADFLRGNGYVVLGIYRTLAALQAGSQPMAVVTVTAGGGVTPGAPQLRGQNLPPATPPATGAAFPTLVTIATTQATTFDSLWQYLLGAVAAMDAFKGSTVVSA